MTQIYRIVFQLAWLAGLLSLIFGFLIKLLHLEAKLTVASHTVFLLAGSFFLCCLATREMQRG
jgi:hypothetical protein